MEEPHSREGGRGGDGAGSTTTNRGHTCQRGEVPKCSLDRGRAGVRLTAMPAVCSLRVLPLKTVLYC